MAGLCSEVFPPCLPGWFRASAIKGHVQHTCSAEATLKHSEHSCSCGFRWDSRTPFPEGSKGGPRHRLRLTPEGLVYLGYGPANLTSDDGRRPRSVVTEDDVNRWEGKSETLRRRGYIRGRAGAALWRLMRGD
jgi:hypothetical protein